MNLEIPVDVSRSLSISGWMSEEELIWLAKAASDHICVCEVGCWRGRSSSAIAKHVLGHLYCVDSWNQNVDDSPPIRHEIDTFGMSSIKDDFYNSILPYKDSVVVVEKDSFEAARMFADSKVYFDMIFIDGAHSYDQVIADVKAYRPLLVDGGLFCGHDCNWPTVQDALRDAGIIWETVAGCIWAMK